MGPCLFETVSAIGTVGLSLGLTPSLGLISHIILILLMFFGRVGGLTLLFAAINSNGVGIVTIGSDFQSSLETTSLLKELGGKLVIARADRDVQEKFLLRNGADEVINPEKHMAGWAAIRYASDHVLDYIKLDDDHAIYEVPVPRNGTGQERRPDRHPQKIRDQYHGCERRMVKWNLSVTPEPVLTAAKPCWSWENEERSKSASICKHRIRTEEEDII